MSKPKHKGPGQPLKYAAPMPRVTVRLDKETVEAARELGEGNMSAGIRLAVKFMAEHPKLHHR